MFHVKQFCWPNGNTGREDNKMRKLNKTLVEKIINNTWYDTRKYSYIYENLIIKRIRKSDLGTTAVYDESRCELFNMYGVPIDRHCLELSWADSIGDRVIDKVYPNEE